MKAINLAIVGKTGVGKSSLLNYLFDTSDLAETGSGKPVTKPGFHKYEKNINNKRYAIFDSFGLEAGKTKLWLKDFEGFIGPLQNSQKIQDWLHSCIYCFSGASARIEPFEIQVVNKLKQQNLNPVIVLTKADSQSAKELAITIREKTGIEPILVSSVEKKTFAGLVEPQGREQLIDQLINNSMISFKNRLTYMLQSIETEEIKLIHESNFNILKDNLVSNKNVFDQISKKSLDTIKNTYETLNKKSFELLKLKLEVKKNEAIVFYKKSIIFPNLEYTSMSEFDSEEYEEKIKAYEWAIVFTIGLPLVAVLALNEIFSPSEQIVNILRGVKTKILESTKNEEVKEYLQDHLDDKI